MQIKNRMPIAMLDEYRRAASDYVSILEKISEEEFVLIRDEETKDADCISIQTLTQHIVHSGYTYANYIGQITEKPWNEYNHKIQNTNEGIEEIEKMLNYTEAYFDGLWHKSTDEIGEWSVKTRWGLTYDFEQLMEHAIVHILRHRRQSEGFLA